MIVVVDSSVLIALSSISRLDWLCKRFPEGINIPEAVWREVVLQSKERSGAVDVREAKWIAVKQVLDRDYVRVLKTGLDDGEAEAIALARELQASVLMLDDKAARTMAQQLGFRVLGTIGFLLWAYEEGPVKDMQIELDRLRNDGGFYVSQDVISKIMKSVDKKASTESNL